MGLFSSLFGSKTKTKSETNPWAPFSQYITGKQDGVTGIPESANNLFEQGGFNQEMQAGNDFYTNFLKQQATDPRLNDFSQAGFDLLGGARDVANGAYDSNFSAVNGMGEISPAGMVDMNAQRKNLGALDPTRAFKEMLSGQPDNRYLDNTVSALTNNLTRNTNENVMPGLRSGAAVSGQYGGSRQGIAEGLAASRLNQDIAVPVTQMYSGALENAKNRMQGTSQYLNDSAYNTAFGNANLGLQNNSQQMQRDQSNANIGFQNNDQLMQRNSQNLSNRMQSMPIAQNGFGLLTGVNDLQGQNYNNFNTAMMQPQNLNWQNMNNYANLMYQGAGLGGTSKGTQTSQPGIIPAALGTAAGIGGIMSGMSGAGGLTKMLGSFK